MLSSKNIFAKDSAAGSDPNNPAAMTMKMKGLLKGLRYISQIFDEEEEPELQIGNPTDVKHVAHIGWDGPTANAPSWINKFKGEGGDAAAAAAAAAAAGDMNAGPVAQDPTTETSSKRKSDKPKGSRRKGSVESSSIESPKKSSENKPGSDSPARDPAASDKKERSSRRKKSKASSGSSSKTSSKSKHTSQSADGLPYSDNGKAPKAGGSRNKET